jgi:cytochrome bd-type quinol oxidase subunit 2
MTTIRYKCDYGHIFSLSQKLILYTSNVLHMKKVKLALKTITVMLLPFTGMAHPGHGETEGFTITHYFTEPVHATVTVILLAGILFTVSYLRRKKSANKNA